MSRRPSASQALAMKAAALAARDDDEPEEIAPVVVAETSSSSSIPETQEQPAEARRGRGRPKGKRTVAARQTIYLDERRHAALTRIADSHGRSVHSLILEGIDHVIGKPKEPGWR